MIDTKFDMCIKSVKKMQFNPSSGGLIGLLGMNIITYHFWIKYGQVIEGEGIGIGIGNGLGYDMYAS